MALKMAITAPLPPATVCTVAHRIARRNALCAAERLNDGVLPTATYRPQAVISGVPKSVSIELNAAAPQGRSSAINRRLGSSSNVLGVTRKYGAAPCQQV